MKEIAAPALSHTGYTEKAGQSSMGSYHVTAGSIQIEPGTEFLSQP